MPSNATWLFGCRKATFTVEQPRPFSPWVGLLLDPSGLVVGHWLSTGPDLDDSVAAWLRDTLRRVGAPAAIRTDDAALAARLGNVGVPVTAGPCPGLDEPFNAMLRALGGPTLQPDYLGDPAVTPAMVKTFFQAADLLWKAAPWRYVQGDMQTLALSIPALGIQDHVVSVMGAAGEQFGWVLWETPGAFRQFTAVGEEVAAAGEDMPPEAMYWLSVTFEDMRDLPNRLQKQAKKLRGHSRQGVPLIMAFRDGRPVHPNPREYRVAIALSEAVAGFIPTFAAEFRHPTGRTTSATITIQYETGPEPLQARLVAPHPALEWPPEDDEPDQDRNTEVAEEMQEDFADWQAERRPARKGSPAHLGAFMIGAMVDRRGHGGHAWDAGMFATFLREVVPEEVALQAENLGVMEAQLQELVMWLEDEDLLTASAAAAVRAALPGWCREAVARASDPANWGPAKRVLQMMHQAGVDPNDTAAVNAFLQKLNAGRPIR
ncbi:MAG: hypothetical protein HY904_18630 [Deltaproteobacteria bacterium]|nr:hypothetical protein [Deltaproteobacteria bacterium]